MKSALPIIKELEKSVNVLVTTVTLSSTKIFEQADLTNTIHQFLPVDIPFLIKKFINHWQPNLGIFIDSEIWPNLIRICSLNRIPLINLNARLSDNSYDLWRKLPQFANFVFSKFSLIIASSKCDTQKIKNFTFGKIIYLGNLKYINNITDYNLNDFASIKNLIGKRQLWLASSTHEGEEEIIINVHKKLLHHFKDLLLVIVPRHPIRGKEIKKIALSHQLQSNLSSEDKNLKGDIYIVDAFGELNLWYKLSSIVFVGKSLVKKGGGHNILEPAFLKSAIIVGQYIDNFKDIINDFKKDKAITIVNDENELFNNVKKLLLDQKYLNSFVEASSNKMKKNSNLLENILNEIKPFL